MLAFPNCKINIGLQVIGKRADGYHDINSVFYPVAIKDALEIIDDPHSNDVHFSASGIPVDGLPESNLCLKAYQLLKKDFPQLPGIKMHLHKTIPIGAGLGGGSADATFTLYLLDKKYSLGLSEKKLKSYALQLGSDCPFFIVNKPCMATGRGEMLEPVGLDLSAYKILLINPGIHINTGWAFSVLEKTIDRAEIATAIKMPVISWQKAVYNDFEEPVCKEYPALYQIKEKLYEAGALYASMSGSGSSFYGIFEKQPTFSLNFPAHYFYKWV